MVKLIIASLRAHAGKTSIIAGLANVLGKPFAYMKPFGDRSLYRKKRLWDQDAALMTHLFGLTNTPEEMTLGFDHSKLHYMYDADSRREKLYEMVRRIGTGKPGPIAASLQKRFFAIVRGEDASHDSWLTRV